MPAARAILCAAPVPLLPRPDGRVCHESPSFSGTGVASSKSKKQEWPFAGVSLFGVLERVVRVCGRVGMPSGRCVTALSVCKISVKCDITITKRQNFLEPPAEKRELGPPPAEIMNYGYVHWVVWDRKKGRALVL